MAQPEPTRCLDPHDFAVPREDRYFEDYRSGEVHNYGSALVTEREIIEFGRRYDPQDMHIDPELAARSSAGGLIASGILTTALTVRLMVDHYLSRVATLPSPGTSSMRFREPVRPGDRLNLRVEVIDARASARDPGRGVVTTDARMLRTDGVTVAEITFIHLFRRRQR